MTDNGKETFVKALAFKYGPMEPSIKANGSIIRLKEKGNLPMLMVIFMTVTGNKIKLLVMESTSTIMGQDTKVNGSMTINTDMVFKLGLMVASMKVTIKKERKMDKENILGKMEAFIKETGLIIKLRAMVNMSGLMEELILEIGSIIKCMEEVLTHGKMEESMKESINSIRNMDSVLILGRMEGSMWESGRTVSAMEEVR